jgi:hypothetical protein
MRHVIDDAARLHFLIFPARSSATGESVAPIWFGPFAWRTLISLSKDSFLAFWGFFLSIFRHIRLPVA